MQSSISRSYVRATKSRRRWRAIGLLFAATAAVPTSAHAHVKWFCNFDVATQPRVLEKVVGLDFMGLTALAVTVLLAGYVLDKTELGLAVSGALDRVMASVRKHTDLVVRATCGFFLVALWTTGGILLTPELKTTSAWLPQLQLAMAAALLWRRTIPLAAVGIVVLFSLAAHDYGLFHLLDYPIFLGVALYLALTGWPRLNVLIIRPLDLLRWSASITLMWASMEKWAYPQWTLPLYLGHPAMSLGYDFELFMQAAGVIEFTLAFALLGTPLVRRASALILIGMFVSAIAEFGKVDAIGHSVIIAVLAVVAADDARPVATARSWRLLARPAVAYAAALLAFLSVYYGMHAVLFGTTFT
jgi:hypothetical protein